MLRLTTRRMASPPKGPIATVRRVNRRCISVAEVSRTIREQVQSARAGQQKSRRLSALVSAREAYRMIRSQVLLSRAGAPPRTVLITSALAGEGKSITAVNTAIAFAHKGRRVLLIDADLRRARCHKLLKSDRGPGLSEVLTGQAELDEVVNSTGVNNLFLMVAGAVPPDPPEASWVRRGWGDTERILRPVRPHHNRHRSDHADQ